MSASAGVISASLLFKGGEDLQEISPRLDLKWELPTPRQFSELKEKSVTLLTGDPVPAFLESRAYSDGYRSSWWPASRLKSQSGKHNIYF